MKTFVKEADVRYINVRLPNGRFAIGHVDDDGRLYLTDEESNPVDQEGNPTEGRPGSGKPGEEPKAGKPGGPEASGKGQTEYNITDKAFTAQLNSVMKDNKFDRVVRHRTKGKIDMKGLPRAEMKREDVFKKKSERKNRNYNVFILVDESGSMHGPKAHQAAETTRFLVEHLQSVEGVRVAVMGFNHVNTPHKEFDDVRQANYSGLEREILRVTDGPNSGCNHDYMAVKESFKRISKEHEGQNFLLYLSDGQPAGCEGPNDSVTIANLIRSAKGITTIGIGIQHDPEQIPHRIVINDLNELKPKILNALKAHIQRG